MLFSRRLWPGAAALYVRRDRLPMKTFLLIYTLATVSLLVFCSWCLFGFQPVLCGTLWAGAVVSTVVLACSRAALSRQRYLVPVAVLASVASVAIGFIAIFLLGAVGSLFH